MGVDSGRVFGGMDLMDGDDIGCVLIGRSLLLARGRRDY